MRYYCYNCRGLFERPIPGRNPYPDYGGEPVDFCPLCGAPENFKETEEPYGTETNDRSRLLGG